MSEESRLNKDQKSSLYLICPSDQLECLIEKGIDDKAYFYTALGVYFEFDIDSQLSLWELIRKKNINKVAFVTSLSNAFFKEAFGQKAKCSSPLTESLQETYLQIYGKSQMNLFQNNFHLLVYQHLNNQISRLMNTEFLGQKIKDDNIYLDAFIYMPQRETFCSLRELKWKGELINKISYN